MERGRGDDDQGPARGTGVAVARRRSAPARGAVGRRVGYDHLQLAVGGRRGGRPAVAAWALAPERTDRPAPTHAPAAATGRPSSAFGTCWGSTARSEHGAETIQGSGPLPWSQSRPSPVPPRSATLKAADAVQRSDGRRAGHRCNPDPFSLCSASSDHRSVNFYQFLHFYRNTKINNLSLIGLFGPKTTMHPGTSTTMCEMSLER